MFSSIAGTIGRIFGTDKAAESLVNNMSQGFDKLVYTSEEKADAEARDVTEARKMLVSWLQATSGQNLARRVLALSITFVWLLQYCSQAAMSVAAVWVDDPIKFIESADAIGGYAETMNGAVMIIIGFYFCAPHIGSFVGVAMDKFGGSKHR